MKEAEKGKALEAHGWSTLGGRRVKHGDSKRKHADREASKRVEKDATSS